MMHTVLVTPPALEPLSLIEGKLRAGLDWAPGDPRDGLMAGFIQTAVGQVQHDTGVALLTQTYGVAVDALPSWPLRLPWRPVQSIVVTWLNAAGVVTTLPPEEYALQPSSADATPATLARMATAPWLSDLRTYAPWHLTLVVGYASVALLQAAAPGLVHAVGLLTAHYATVGRDRFSEQQLQDEYQEAIAPHKLVTLA